MRVTLKAMRVNAELTQDQAAQRAGISKVTLNNWENNKTSPSVTQLMKMCDLYGCTLNDIFLPKELTKS